MSKRPPKRPTRRRCCSRIEDLLEARLFKALCDPGRIAILARLARSNRPRTVGQIAECCPTDLSVVSRHLATLREAGILMAEKRGKQVFYCVRCQDLASTLRKVADAVEACCPPAKGKRKESNR